jgi:hypothetical protein
MRDRRHKPEDGSQELNYILPTSDSGLRTPVFSLQFSDFNLIYTT